MEHLKSIASLLILSVATVTGCQSIQNKFAFHPDKTTTINVDVLPDYISRHQVQTPDDETLTAYYFAHEEVKPKRTILYFHGNAGNLYHRFDYCQKLWEMGYDVFIVSYRGYAESTGTPSELGVYTDGKSALNYMQSALKINKKEIAIIGRSIGTTVAVNTAMHEDLAALILVTPLTSGYEMAQNMVPSMASIAQNTFESIVKINEIKVPLLIIHGTEDEVIPYEMGVKLFETYNGQKQLVTIALGHHNDLQDVDPARFWGSIDQFIRF